ncbi:MAG: substrate-binding domain-containing protein [Candidatus Marinarcus sp.]|uniref:substrate-binding domain-containing protein n=1 Tax=Candidatus Marinarcus sp. TaxID=3100987 RepID=UPI003B0076F6
MKYLMLGALFVTWALGNSFWTIDEFLQINPQEKFRMQTFDRIVQSDAVALKQKREKIKISMLYPGNQLTDYWTRSQKSFEARLKELNIPYEIKPIFVDENDVKKLQLKLKELLDSKSDYLIFTLNIDGHKKLISQIITNKKPKIILQNITTPLKEWGNNQPFMYVGFDHIEGTKLLVQYYKKKFPNGAKYLMLYHNEGYVSQVRGDSFINMMGAQYDLKGSYYTYVKKDLAKKIVLNFQSIKDTDFIYNCSTDIAIGASEAVKALQLENKILLNGWGGGSTELAMIENHDLNVTVMRMNDDNGVAMAEAIKLDLLQKKVPLIYSGKFELVDDNFSAQSIELLKKQAFRYSK